ncbi:MAG: RyR domain-containing protein, partial [Chloroflexota bacterium]
MTGDPGGNGHQLRRWRQLLSGDVDGARRRYGDAFRRYRDRSTHVESTTLQLSLILPALGLTADPEAFLHEPATSTGAHAMSSYEPRPSATDGVELPDSLREAAERLAEHVHDVWAERRIAEGWRYGPTRDDEARTHPDLVSYADLPESEKEYDRATATETIKALLEMGF